MTALQESILEVRLETICEKGCRRVREVIATLESGGQPAETQDLNGRERAWLLAELKGIMAVYSGYCGLEPEGTRVD